MPQFISTLTKVYEVLMYPVMFVRLLRSNANYYQCQRDISRKQNTKGDDSNCVSLWRQK